MPILQAKLFIPIVLITLVSCDRSDKIFKHGNLKVKDKTEFDSWVNQNTEKLTKEREIGNLSLRMHYIPSASDQNQVFSFSFVISPLDKVNLFNQPNTRFISGESRMMYWSSGIQNDLTLMTDRDTIPCSIVVFENSGSIRNDITVNIGFSSNRKDHSNYTVVYDDQYFGLGRLNFSFDKIINNIPIIESTK